MRSQSILIVALVFIVLIVMGIIIFLPTSTTQLPVIQGDVSSLPDTETTGQTSDNGTSTSSTGQSEMTPIPDGAVLTGTSVVESSTAAVDRIASPEISSSTPPPHVNPSAGNPNIPGMIPGGIAGTVKDSQGKFLPGVSIQVLDKPVIMTDAQGAFRVENLTEKVVSLTAQLAGYQTVEREDIPVGTPNLEIVLIQEGSIAGKVLDQFGDPIALAQVQGRALQGIWAVESSADAEGRFIFTEAPNIQVRIQASQEGFTDSGSGFKEIDSPSNEEIILKLDRPTFSISGKVFAQDTQQGINGFKLQAVLQDAGSNPEILNTATEASGFYRFEKLKQGTYVVSSVAKDNASLNYVIPLKYDFQSVRLYEKSVDNIDFAAVTGLTVSGKVLTSNNQGVANAEVTVAGLQSVQTQSSSDGQFRLTGVPVTGGQTLDRFEIRLQASHTDYGTGLSDPLPSESGQEITGIQIVLDGVSQLTGVVQDSAGAPVGEARVVLQSLIQGDSQETMTDSLGNFVFAKVATSDDTLTAFSGTHKISAEKENYSTVQQQILLKTGEQQSVTLTMESSGSIQGRIYDPNGEPLGGVTITTQLPRGSVVSTVSESSGMYLLTGLTDGAFDIHCRVDSEPPLTGVIYQIATGSTGADVTLSAGKWDLMGTVTDAQTGQKITQYMLSIEGTPKNPRAQHFVLNRSVNTPDGTYHLTLTETGIYRIRFLASNYQSLEEKADIDLTTLRLQYINPQLQPLQTTGGIQGSFQPPDGVTLVGVNVPGVQAYSAQNNSFLLEGIPVGNHDLIFHVLEQSSGAIYEIGVLTNVPVSENQITDIGSISVQNITTYSRNF